MQAHHPSLSGFPVISAFEVLWGDEDAFGHVNSLVYLRWCETARVEYLVRVRLCPPYLPEGVGPILASLRCDYRAPLHYSDTVEIGTRVTRVGNSSIHMEHVMVSEKSRQIVAEVESTLVMLDYRSYKPTPVPGDARRAIGAVEARPG